MRDSFDVLGIGCATVDDLIVADSYPPADVKLQVKRMERHFGGLTATALVAAAKLGGRCAFAGMLGTDELSRAIEANFAGYGVDVSHVVRRADSKPIHAVIVVAEADQTRTIFYEYDAPTGADPDAPSAEIITSASVLFLDHLSPAGGLRAARMAHDAGVPIVADLEEIHGPEFDDLLDLVDHVVVSDDFARELTGAADPATALFGLWSPCRQAVVVTCGRDGAWYASAENRSPQFHAAFQVEVVDTTGCGDVFHGAYALALAHGKPAADRVRFASAAAALKATAIGGQVGAPTAEQVAVFLAGNKVKR